MIGKFKLAICQMKVIENKNANIEKALELIRKAASNMADMVVLPEMFNCPYDNSKFKEYSESIEDGATIKAISKIAKELNLYIVAGSIPEEDAGRIYNTSFIFNRNGEIIGKHRKIHLFDIDVSGGIAFKESEILTAGDEITVVATEFCKIGVAICYDMRFPELLRIMTLKGAKVIIIPAAFNLVTGPAHWESLIRTRAVDNQVYIAAVSPARDEEASYVAFGNSMVVEPWGKIAVRADEIEEIKYADIDLAQVEKVRNELPLLKHRREDIYKLEQVGKK